MAFTEGERKHGDNIPPCSFSIDAKCCHKNYVLPLLQLDLPFCSFYFVLNRTQESLFTGA